MSWVRVMCSRGGEFVAPSFAPPPPFLGLERVCASPGTGPRLLTAQPALSPSNAGAEGETITVLVEQYDAGAVLGHVIVAVAASESEVRAWELASPGIEATPMAMSQDSESPVAVPRALLRLLRHVKAALVASDESGIQLMLDSVCSSAVPHVARRGAQESPQSTANMRGATSTNAAHRAHLGLPVPSPTTPRAAATYSRLESAQRSSLSLPSVTPAGVAAEWLRRRAFLSFVATHAVPLSPLWSLSVLQSAPFTQPNVPPHQVPASSASSSSARSLSHSSAPASWATDNFVCTPAFAASATAPAGTPATAGVSATSAERASVQQRRHQAASWTALSTRVSAAVGDTVRALDQTVRHVLSMLAPPADKALCAEWESAWRPDAVTASSPFRLPVIALWSPSGLLTASASFLRDLSPHDHLRLAAVAVHHLVTPTAATVDRGSAKGADAYSLVRTVSFVFYAHCPHTSDRGEETSAAARHRRFCSGCAGTVVGMYDMVLVVVGHALAVLIGFVRTGSDAPSLAAAPLAAWIEAAASASPLQMVLPGAARSSATADSPQTPLCAAAQLAQSAASSWSTIDEQARNVLEAAATGTAPTRPHGAPTLVSQPCEPAEGTPDLHGDRTISQPAHGAGDAPTTRARRPFKCIGAVCARKSRRGVEHVDAVNVPAVSHKPGDPATTPTSTPALSHSSRAVSTIHDSHDRLNPQIVLMADNEKDGLFASWVHTAARITVLEWDLSHMVEQQGSVGLSSSHVRPLHAWADGLHAAFWCAQPHHAPLATSPSPSPPGYTIGFFRRTLQSAPRGTTTSAHVEDPTGLLPSFPTACADDNGATRNQESLCVVRPRASLVTSTFTQMACCRGDAASASASSSDADDDENNEDGGTDEFDEEDDDFALLTCLCVSYTHIMKSAQPQPCVSFAICSVASLYGVHLGVEATLMEALSTQKSVLGVTKAASAEVEGVERCTVLLRTLQSLVHNVVESVHAASL